MNYVTEPERRTGILCKADEVVPGGGPAGIAAAWAAARQCRPTVLVGHWGKTIGQTGAKAD